MSADTCVLCGTFPHAQACPERPDLGRLMEAVKFMPGRRSRLRAFVLDNWATLLLVAASLVLCAVHTFMFGR